MIIKFFHNDNSVEEIEVTALTRYYQHMTGVCAVMKDRVIKVDERKGFTIISICYTTKTELYDDYQPMTEAAFLEQYKKALYQFDAVLE